MVKLLIILLFTACVTQRDIQVERARLTFNRMEQLYRDGKEMYAYYWTDDEGEIYVEYCKYKVDYPKGYVTVMFVRR